MSTFIFNFLFTFLNIMNFIVWTKVYFTHTVKSRTDLRLKFIFLILSGLSFIVLIKPFMGW